MSFFKGSSHTHIEGGRYTNVLGNVNMNFGDSGEHYPSLPFDERSRRSRVQGLCLTG
jgi:hypothetical protein